MKKRLALFALLLSIVAAPLVYAQGPAVLTSAPTSGAQTLTQLLGPTIQSPNLTCVASSLVCTYTAGYVYTPNGVTTLNAGSVTVTANATTCARPSFTSCDFIYYTSGTTLSTTQVIATATAVGNSILAYITSNASGVLTLVAPYMDTSTPIVPIYSPAASNATGIYDFSQAAQSQVVVSATEYYLTNSNLNMPAVYTTAIAAGTTMRWRFAINKTAAGTGTFQLLLKKGTAGTIGDTSIVTQTIGTQTAVADNAEFDVTLTWTSATAAYWTITPRQSAASGTGFGLVYPAVAVDFNSTISAQTTTTASDKYGLSVIFTTGTPTFIVTQMQAQAFGVN